MGDSSKIQFFTRSHKGKVKPNNEDYLRVAPERQVAVIADGIGGKEYGEIASETAVESCIKYLCNADLTLLQKRAQREIANAVKYANETVITIQRNNEKYRNMDSTLACCWIDQQQLHYSWVGDSRIYLLQPSASNITMLSKDHTLDRSKIDANLAPDLYKRASSILTQTVGGILLLSPETGSAQLNDGDIILICTDGLSDRVPDELLLEYSLKFIDNLDAYADKLLDRALDCGGQDNISFILAKVSLWSNFKQQSASTLLKLNKPALKVELTLQRFACDQRDLFLSKT